jgi:glycosyltransferase involved in cell wall biosynthesis
MLPLLGMEKEAGRIADTIRENEFEEGKWDIVFINRMWGKDDLFELRKKHGFKLVVDVDDYWILDHRHHDYDLYRDHNVSHKIAEHLRQADLVTVTHERLAERVFPYNSNVIVCPNAIPYGHGQFIDQRTESDKVRLFWAGGISHVDDMKILAAPMQKILKSGLDVMVNIGGYADSNPFEKSVWDKMASYITADGNLPNNAYRGREITQYYDLFVEADVMLIPLIKSNFNQYKSNLKILEAAGKGIPVIVSAVHPYLGFPEDLVNYASDTQMWVHWIGKLVSNPKMREEQGQALREYCEKNYNFWQINQLRQLAFETLVKEKISQNQTISI